LRERFDAGTGLVALGAVMLLVSLFVDWFRPGGDAWAVFEWVDVFLAGCALAAIAALVPRYGGLARALLPVAFVALAVVAVQLIDLPPAARGAERATGAWLALAATALMSAGAALSLARISVTVDVRGRERRRRAAAVDARESAAEAAEEPAPTPRRTTAQRPPVEEPPPVTDAPARARRRATTPAAGDADAAGGADRAGADDPQRTQALEPVERPREES
jgi:hypothetical protein